VGELHLSEGEALGLVARRYSAAARSAKAMAL